MFYQAPGLTNSLSSLQGLLNNITPQTFQSMTSIPSFTPFNQQMSQLAPQNFISVDPNGIQSIFNPANLSTSISTAINGITQDLIGTATNLLNSIAGNALGSVSSFLGGGLFNDVFGQLISIAQGFSTNSNNQMLDILNQNFSGMQLGNYNQVIENSFNTFTNVTPRYVRDLSNPQFFNSQLNGAVSSAQQNLTTAVTQNAVQTATNPGFSNSAQFPLQQQSTPSYSGNNQDGFDLRIRRTVYWSYGPGTDVDSAAKRSSTGRQLAEGVSAAVDPSIIPYLSRIEFPDIGVRFATDTGGAVKRRTASGGRLPIIDIYFENRQNALAFANQFPKEVTVKVYPPKTKYKYAKGAPPTYGTA